jgi:hypothetical protein
MQTYFLYTLLLFFSCVTSYDVSNAMLGKIPAEPKRKRKGKEVNTKIIIEAFKDMFWLCFMARAAKKQHPKKVK